MRWILIFVLAFMPENSEEFDGYQNDKNNSFVLLYPNIGHAADFEHIAFGMMTLSQVIENISMPIRFHSDSQKSPSRQIQLLRELH